MHVDRSSREHRRRTLRLGVCLVALLDVCSSLPSFSEEIPIQKCDRLPVIKVVVSGKAMRFLVDTAATSILNINSFSAGNSKNIEVTSWSGTVATSAREITLPEILIGHHRLQSVKLPAIDLTPIGNVCGDRIDGIMGSDLLEKLAITLDLKRQIVSLPAPAGDGDNDPRIAGVKRDLNLCVAAFNRADATAFGECFDPHIALFALNSELYGREPAMEYFRRRYFSVSPAAHLEISPWGFRAAGEAVWYEYEFTIRMPDKILRGQGIAMCRNSDGHWRLLSMHHYTPAGANANGD
jgi:SnoaL-like domain/Aspartyl protease